MPAPLSPGGTKVPSQRAPRAPRVPTERLLHGVRDVDEYAWMRDRESPELQAYLAAERAYYDSVVQPLSGLSAQLLAEARGRVPDRPENSVAWQRDGWWYRTRRSTGAEHEQLLRWRVDGDAAGRSTEAGSPEQVVLDLNLVAADTGYAEVGVREPSPDGTMLAWSTDRTGAELYELSIRDLTTGEDLPEVIGRTYTGSAWSSDSKYLFYLVPDHVNRPHQLWRHRVGSEPDEDELVYEESDRRFEMTLRTSRSGELVVATSASRETTEVRIIPACNPTAAPVVVEPRRRGVEYWVDHGSDPQGDRAGPGELYIVTNDEAKEYRLVRAPVSSPGRSSWRELACPAVYPARVDTRLLGCDVFAHHLLLTLRRGGSPLLAVADRDGDSVRELASGFPAGSIRVEHAESYDSGKVTVAEESLVEPPVSYELDLATATRRQLERKEVVGYRSELYRTERRWARVADGTRVPVTLAWREGVELDGRAPCLCYGYGAYEACSDPEFDLALPSLLDRGVVYAIAHVRGGGECGRAWWEEGHLRDKPNTFSDFVGVADWLAGDAPGSEALVDGERIVSRGLSAGGLLQGAAYSQAPGRWRAVVAEVPFVDCVNSMLDAEIPLTVNEWDEWGDPRDPGDFAVMRSYSPYENPPACPRPALLVTGSVNDPRVLVHEPAKWVAKLRESDDGRGTILFRPELGAAAHTGPSGHFAHLDYEAEVQAFVLDAMGYLISKRVGE